MAKGPSKPRPPYATKVELKPAPEVDPKTALEEAPFALAKRVEELVRGYPERR